MSITPITTIPFNMGADKVCFAVVITSPDVDCGSPRPSVCMHKGQIAVYWEESEANEIRDQMDSFFNGREPLHDKAVYEVWPVSAAFFDCVAPEPNMDEHDPPCRPGEGESEGSFGRLPEGQSEGSAGREDVNFVEAMEAAGLPVVVLSTPEDVDNLPDFVDPEFPNGPPERKIPEGAQWQAKNEGLFYKWEAGRAWISGLEENDWHPSGAGWQRHEFDDEKTFKKISPR